MLIKSEMEGPFHEFMLVDMKEFNESKHNTLKILAFAQKLERIELSDDLIFYMNDFFNWIPCYNPSSRKNHNGLNHYGITLIKKEGVHLLRKIFESWENLFTHAPEMLILRGMFCHNEEDSSESDYERIRICKEVLVNRLQDLKQMAIQAEEEEAYILHFGI